MKLGCYAKMHLFTVLLTSSKHALLTFLREKLGNISAVMICSLSNNRKQFLQLYCSNLNHRNSTKMKN